MGAWGYGLFQSDHDLDTVSDFDSEAGLYKLSKAAIKAANSKEGAAGKEKKSADEDKAAEDDDFEYDERFYYTVYNGGSDPGFVRKHLDSGVMVKLIAKYEKAMSAPRDKYDFIDPGYTFVLLGACAMSVGATLPESYLKQCRRKFRYVGFMPDALLQLHTALNDKTKGYKNGVPYEFDSPGLIKTANRRTDPEPNGMGWNGLNVAAPFGLFKGPQGPVIEFPDGVCGGCGSEKGDDGQDLMVCSKCKKKKYCSKECQQAHWKAHKKMCKA